MRRFGSLVALALLGCGSDNLGDDATTTAAETGATNPDPTIDPTIDPTTGLPPSHESTTGDEGSTTGDATDESGTTADPGSDSSTTAGAEVCDPPESLEVLFIGNSFTFTHDLPGMVATLGDQAGVPITTMGQTVAGMNFAFHVGNPATQEAIDASTWDYIVIQGHSLETINDLESFLTNGQTLVAWIEEAGAQPLLYETWARAPGHSLYNDPGFPPDDPDEMQAAIEEGYAMLSELTGAPVVPAGDAWQVLWMSEHIDAIDPWGPDDYHPSPAGTYLNASVFFVALTELSLETLDLRAGDPPIDSAQADILHDIAHSVVTPCGAR